MTKGLHRFTLLLAGATLLLIVAGALVTSHDAGLATSDWPLTEGRFLPKSESLGITNGVNMVGNLFWEHGHRMIATTVGILTVVLVVFLFMKEPRQWVRRLGILSLLGVIAQGLLGGLTVKLMLPLAVSAAHATLAQLFFCTTVALAVFTSKSWIEARPTLEEKGTLPVRYLAVAAAITIFLQLILGATLRHSATWDRPLPTDLVVAHIGGGIAVALMLGATSLMVLRRHAGEKFLTRPAVIALALLGVQLMLGVAAYMARLASPNDPQPLRPMIGITVAHVACGALVFATSIALTFRAFRVLRATDPSFELASSEALYR
ncbi:MAG: COX15/CtaA family protein [bacterium]